ncbi:MAG: ATP-binding protein [Bacillota bacterium]|nr:ATP-binding protein [Bacillota bacterium]
MTKKIFKNILAVSIAALVVCILCVSYVLYGYFEDIIKDELKTEAYLISQEMGDDENQLERLDPVNNRITLIDKNGTVLYDSRADEASMENHSSREEIIEARNNGDAYSVRYSDTLSTKTIYYAVLIDDGNVLRVAQDQNVVALLLKGIIVPFVIILIITALLASIISRTASRRIIAPINDMDLNDDDADEPYPELAPLMTKIRQQNKHIQLQLDEMKRRQKEFIAITENMNEGFLLIDRSMEILSYNTAALELLGDGGESVPHTALELNRSKGFRTAVEKALLGSNNQQAYETENRCYNIVANPVSENGSVVGAVVIVMDVTEKEQREKLRREFTSNVSHELKTPLTTIYGVSDMMAEGIVKAEDVRSFGMTIKDESGRMISLIDDIIKLSKLDENPAAEEMSEVDLFELASVVAERLKINAEEKKVSVRIEGESTVIKGVPSLCEEIIYNLCENAIKYNKEGGSVRVEAKPEASGAVLVVEDTGIGIPYEYQDRVFERFFRADKSHSNQIKGTGLGLSIVKNAVLYLGGRVELDSTEGKGTRITVHFFK